MRKIFRKKFRTHLINIPAAILAFWLRLCRISQKVLNVALATPARFLLILLASLKNPKFRFRHIYKMSSAKILASAFLSMICMLVSFAAYAQAGSVGVSKPLVLLVILVVLSLSPFLVMMITSFVKIAVVLALVRNALGTQQIPPNVVITGLAIILTIYVMMPVGYDVYRTTKATINQGTNQPVLSQATIELLSKAVGGGKEPVRQFLLKHVHAKERALFYNLSMKLRTNEEDREGVTDQDFINLVPAFVVSELTDAFQIGFIIFLPFLIIDLVIANILLSLGMFQISPVTISLPFKLLLFVLVDGWHIIAKGLVLGYV